MTQAQALTVLLSGRSAFLTGEPGAGKTYVLSEFVRRVRKDRRRVAVTASTGIAATHIGGMTVHVWSGLGTRDKLTKQARQQLLGNPVLLQRYRKTDVLVIDEVSMLHGARLNLLDEACRLMRGIKAPFGGLQVVLVGDLFQLPPVVDAGKECDFVHNAGAWAGLDPAICYLTEQHRQQQDPLLDMLRAVRAGTVRAEHRGVLQARLEQEPPVDVPIVRLCTHNRDADALNGEELAALPGESRRYGMPTEGEAIDVARLKRNVLAPDVLALKIGAKVMFVANNPAKGYMNGMRGMVTGFRGGLPHVRLASGQELTVEPHVWTLTEDNRERASVTQLPLRLGWAITIHKSQGMSLDAAVIDLRKCFTPGMGYVALSRVRSLDGVYLRGINNMALQVHPEIAALDKALREASARLETAGAPRLRHAEALKPKQRPVASAPRRRPVRHKRRRDRQLAESVGVVAAVAACALMLVV